MWAFYCLNISNQTLCSENVNFDRFALEIFQPDGFGFAKMRLHFKHEEWEFWHLCGYESIDILLLGHLKLEGSNEKSKGEFDKTGEWE